MPNTIAVTVLAAASLGTIACASHAPHSSALTTDAPGAGEPASLFAPGVISTGDVFASTFTPDGNTVVFTRFTPPRMVLMISTFAGNHWSAPTPLPFSGEYRDLDPAFTPDGSRLFFSSWRPTSASPADTTNASDTWYADRLGSAWSTPVHLAAPVNSAEQDYYPSIARNGALYFDSFRSRPRKRLAYRAGSRGGGEYDAPQPLSPVINADSGASNLFVDPDERYVIFGAVRPEGHGGVDLYLSWRDGASWTTPQNLGALVNTAATEFCPFVSRDGKYLYFTRVSVNAGAATRNIYVVRFDKLLEKIERPPH